MRLARLRKADFATPIVALFCDGAYYDVAELEARWFARRPPLGGDFFERVVSRRASGLRELYDRLFLGDRPTEARIVAGEYLPLPPTAVDRCSLFRFGPVDEAPEEPRASVGNSRALVGDGSPAVFGGGGPAACEIGLAVVLAEDMSFATPQEAQEAVLGFGLMVDWHRGPRKAEAAEGGLGLATHFGPDLVVRDRGTALVAEAMLTVDVGGQQREVVSAVCAFEPSEALSYLSQRCALRAGDVVGLGAMMALEGLSFGEPVDVSCKVSTWRTRQRLRAWAACGAPPANWRRTGGGPEA